MKSRLIRYSRSMSCLLNTGGKVTTWSRCIITNNKGFLISVSNREAFSFDSCNKETNESLKKKINFTVICSRKATHSLEAILQSSKIKYYLMILSLWQIRWTNSEHSDFLRRLEAWSNFGHQLHEKLMFLCL